MPWWLESLTVVQMFWVRLLPPAFYEDFFYVSKAWVPLRKFTRLYETTADVDKLEYTKSSDFTRWRLKFYLRQN